MAKALRCLLPLIALLAVQAPQAAELSGRFSMLGSTAQAEAGDIGYGDGSNTALSADQQSLRMMLNDEQQSGEWSLHLDTSRLHLDGYPEGGAHSSELFRYQSLSGSWLDESGERSRTHIGYALDRAFYRHYRDNLAVSLGRQPIDWGSGRFWQPLNVFGAFAPTELDTDFKPGIDALTVEWYPSAFSSLTVAYLPAPKRGELPDDSGAVYYRRAVGEMSELSLLVGSVLGNQVAGGAFESAWGGMGWRMEGVYSRSGEGEGNAHFWIAGVDYQFSNGTLLTAEWYDHSRGATEVSELETVAAEPQFYYGLQQQLGRRVLGLSLARDLTPLVQGSYTLLGSSLRDDNSEQHVSLLHQLNMVYSVSNESDLLLSVLLASGSGTGPEGEPQSEFGHLPASLSLRLRFYF